MEFFFSGRLFIIVIVTLCVTSSSVTNDNLNQQLDSPYCLPKSQATRVGPHQTPVLKPLVLDSKLSHIILSNSLAIFSSNKHTHKPKAE